MHITQKFKDIKKPEDITPEALESYLSNLYQGLTGFMEQANLLINELKRISGNSKFEEVRVKLEEYESALEGETKDIIRKIKDSAETLCYKLSQYNVIPPKFYAEISSATLNACPAGTLTSMQKILYSIDESLYTQKYDYIQNLAVEYVREHNLSDRRGNEVHKVNELIHEVSIEYNLVPPRDVHARYRDLSQNPNEDFIKNFRFKDYLNRHFLIRHGIYSLVESIANRYLSMLPDVSNGKNNSPTEITEQFKSYKEQIIIITDLLNITETSLVEYSEAEWPKFSYRSDYISIIKAAVIRQLIKNELIEHESLSVRNSQTIEIPARHTFIKDGQGKIVKVNTPAKTQVIETEEQLIESPDSWYIVEVIADKIAITKKSLDTNSLRVLRIDKENIEDYLYKILRVQLNGKESFENNLLKIIVNIEPIEASKKNWKALQTEVINKLILLSDLARFFQTKLSLTNQETLELIRENKYDLLELLNLMHYKSPNTLSFVAQHPVKAILDFYLKYSVGAKGKILNWRDNAGNSILHIAAEHGYVESIQKLVELKVNIHAVNENANTALHIAAAYGRVEAIEELAKLGANLGSDVKSRNFKNNSALHIAAERGHVEAIEKLVELKADIEAINRDGETALHVAIRGWRLEVVQKLVDLGAEINAVNNYGSTALHIAAVHGRVEAIGKLVELKADIEAINKDGNTALHIAAVYGRVKAIEKLVDLGAEINAENKDGNTALHIAAVYGSVEAIEKLVDLGTEINAENKDGNRALHIAAVYGIVEAIEKLVELKADIEAINRCGETALHVAIREGRLGAVQKLLELGAEINAENKDGSTALHIAAESGNVEVIQKLAKLRVEINIKDKNDNTVLHIAAKNNQVKSIEKLYELGAEINAVNTYGNTALHVAAERGYVEVIQKLANLGGDVNVKDKNGNTALHVAAERGYVEVIQKLANLGGDVNVKDKNGNTALHVAAERGYVEVIQKLANLGGDVNVKDKNGNTALHVAAERGHVEVIQKLANLGIDIEAKNKNGNTALHVAAERGHVEVIQKLANLGVDIEAKNKNGNTALHAAAERDRVEVIQELANLGGDVNVKDKNGNTALHVAAKNDQVESIEKLFVLGAKIEAKNINDNTALHTAASSDCVSAVERLVFLGSDTQAKDDYGNTALDLAILKRHVGVIEKLSELGVEIDGFVGLYNTLKKKVDNVVSVSEEKSGSKVHLKHFSEYTGKALIVRDDVDNFISPVFEEYSINSINKLIELSLINVPVDKSSKIISLNSEIIEFSQNGTSDLSISIYEKYISKYNIILQPILFVQSEFESHWMGFVITKDSNAIHLNYLDSENQAAPFILQSILVDEIQRLIPSTKVVFNQISLETQRYNNCGPELIENVIYYLTGTRATQEAAVYLHSLLYENSLLDPVSSAPQIAENNRLIAELSNQNRPIYHMAISYINLEDKLIMNKLILLKNLRKYVEREVIILESIGGIKAEDNTLIILPDVHYSANFAIAMLLPPEAQTNGDIFLLFSTIDNSDKYTYENSGSATPLYISDNQARTNEANYELSESMLNIRNGIEFIPAFNYFIKDIIYPLIEEIVPETLANVRLPEISSGLLYLAYMGASYVGAISLRIDSPFAKAIESSAPYATRIFFKEALETFSFVDLSNNINMVGYCAVNTAFHFSPELLKLYRFYSHGQLEYGSRVVGESLKANSLSSFQRLTISSLECYNSYKRLHHSEENVSSKIAVIAPYVTDAIVAVTSLSISCNLIFVIGNIVVADISTKTILEAIPANIKTNVDMVLGCLGVADDISSTLTNIYNIYWQGTENIYSVKTYQSCQMLAESFKVSWLQKFYDYSSYSNYYLNKTIESLEIKKNQELTEGRNRLAEDFSEERVDLIFDYIIKPGLESKYILLRQLLEGFINEEEYNISLSRLNLSIDVYETHYDLCVSSNINFTEEDDKIGYNCYSKNNEVIDHLITEGTKIIELYNLADLS